MSIWAENGKNSRFPNPLHRQLRSNTTLMISDTPIFPLENIP